MVALEQMEAEGMLVSGGYPGPGPDNKEGGNGGGEEAGLLRPLPRRSVAKLVRWRWQTSPDVEKGVKQPLLERT